MADLNNLREGNRLRSQENELLQIGASLAAQFTDQARTLTEELKEQLGIRSRYNEQERGTIALSRQIISTAKENNTLLRKQGGLRSQIRKDQQLTASLDREILGILQTNEVQAERINETARELSILQGRILKLQNEEVRLKKEIANASDIESGILKTRRKLVIDSIASLEDEIKILRESSGEEEKRLAVLYSSRDTLNDITDTRLRELNVDNQINRTLGLTGAILDNLNKIGIRAFGGLGINLGTFSEAIASGKERMDNLGEAFVRLNSLSEISKESATSITEELKRQTGVRSTLINRENNSIGKLSQKLNLEKGVISSYLSQAKLLKGITNFLQDTSISENERKEATERLESLTKNILANDSEYLQLVKDINSARKEGLESLVLEKESELNQLVQDRLKVLGTVKDVEISTFSKTRERLDQVNDSISKLQESKDSLLSIGRNLISVLSGSEQEKFNSLITEQQSIQSQIDDTLRERRELIISGNQYTEEGRLALGRLTEQAASLTSDLNKNVQQQEAFAEKAVESAKELGFVRRGFLAIKQALPEVGEALKDALFDPLTLSTIATKAIKGLFKRIKDAFGEVNKASVQFQRLTGEVAASTAVINTNLVTAAEVLTSMSQITQDLGVNTRAVFSPQQLADLAEAQKLLGLSAEQSNVLALRSFATGDSIAEYETSFLKGVNKANKLNKTVVAAGVALKDALNVSADITITFLDSEEALGQAATNARALGLELKDINKVASALVDFETSIQDQLQAQLLTGKELDLTRARQFAITNDLAGLSQELLNLDISAAEFADMNLYARQSLAKTLGLSTEELAKSLLLQQGTANLTDEQLQSAYGVTREQLRTLTVTEALNTAVQKLFQSFTPVLEKVAIPLVNVLTDITTAVSSIGAGIKNIIPDFLKTEAAVKAIGISILAIGGIWGSLKLISKVRGVLLILKALNAQWAISKIKALASASATAVDTANKIANAGAAGAATTANSALAVANTAVSTTAGPASVGMRSIGAAAAVSVKGILAFAAGALAVGAAIKLAEPSLKSLFNYLGKVVTSLKEIIIEGMKQFPTIISSVTDNLIKLLDSISLKGIAKFALLGPALTLASIGIVALGTASLLGAPGLLILAGATLAVGKAIKLAEPSVVSLFENLNRFATTVVDGMRQFPTVISSVTSNLVNLLDSITLERIGRLTLLGAALLSASTGLGAFAAAGAIGRLPAKSITGGEQTVSSVNTVVPNVQTSDGQSILARKLDESTEQSRLQNETSQAILLTLRDLLNTVQKGASINIDGSKLEQAILLNTVKT